MRDYKKIVKSLLDHHSEEEWVEWPEQELITLLARMIQIKTIL